MISSFLDNNYTFSLMIPIWYIIIFVLVFTKAHYDKAIAKLVSIIVSIIILAIVCSLYMFNFSETYIMNWIFKPIVPFILMLYLPMERKLIEGLDKKDKFRFSISIIIGLAIMLIPGSRWYTLLISNIEHREVIISEALVYFCGVITIFLNKYAINKISKIKKWDIRLNNR